MHEVAPQLLDALLSKIEKAPTPEKVAENDYLMKCMYHNCNHTSEKDTDGILPSRCHACDRHCPVYLRCWLRADTPAAGRHSRCDLEEPEQPEL